MSKLMLRDKKRGVSFDYRSCDFLKVNDNMMKILTVFIKDMERPRKGYTLPILVVVNGVKYLNCTYFYIACKNRLNKCIETGPTVKILENLMVKLKEPTETINKTINKNMKMKTKPNILIPNVPNKKQIRYSLEHLDELFIYSGGVDPVLISKGLVRPQKLELFQNGKMVGYKLGDGSIAGVSGVINHEGYQYDIKYVLCSMRDRCHYARGQSTVRYKGEVADANGKSYFTMTEFDVNKLEVILKDGTPWKDISFITSAVVEPTPPVEPTPTVEQTTLPFTQEIEAGTASPLTKDELDCYIKLSIYKNGGTSVKQDISNERDRIVMSSLLGKMKNVVDDMTFA